MALRINCCPAVKLQSARSTWTAQKGQSQLTILTRVSGSRDQDTAVVARQDLSLAVKIGRSRQKRTKRRAREIPAGLLTHRIVEKGQSLSISDKQQIPTAIGEANSPRSFHLQRSCRDLPLRVRLGKISGHCLHRRKMRP